MYRSDDLGSDDRVRYWIKYLDGDEEELYAEECRDILISQDAILDHDKTTTELKKLDQELQKDKKVYFHTITSIASTVVNIHVCMACM